jgi:hypothetical protein
MSKVVRKTTADSPMTPACKRKLAQLGARPDSKFDFSEIPALRETFWKNAFAIRFIDQSSSSSRCAWMPMCWRGSASREKVIKLGSIRCSGEPC